MDVIGLTEKELQTITAAMAGNFPESLSQYRMGALRKLAKARPATTQGAVDDLAKIADLAKYLREPAWTEEGIRLVGEQIQRLASPHLRGR